MLQQAIGNVRVFLPNPLLIAGNRFRMRKRRAFVGIPSRQQRDSGFLALRENGVGVGRQKPAVHDRVHCHPRFKKLIGRHLAQIGQRVRGDLLGKRDSAFRS